MGDHVGGMVKQVKTARASYCAGTIGIPMAMQAPPTGSTLIWSAVSCRCDVWNSLR